MKRLLLSVAVVSLALGQFAAVAKNALSEEDFVKVPSKLKFTPKELEEYVDFTISQRETQKKIESGELILSNDPNRNWKRGMKFVKGTAGFAFDVLAPVGAQVAARALGDVIINYVAPYSIKYTGKVAANVASSASSWWTQYDPTGLGDKFVRGAAKATAQGEAYRDVGTIADYVQKYGVPAIQSTYRVGKVLATSTATLGKKVGSSLSGGLSKARSYLSGWFATTKVAAAA